MKRNARGGINITVSGEMAALKDANRLSWTVDQYAGYLDNARENKKGMLAIQTFKRVRNVDINDNTLLDFNISAEELMLLDKTSDDQLIQEIAKTGFKNLLELCFAKNMITNRDHFSKYIINVGKKEEVVNVGLYDVLAWFGCNEILKKLFEKDVDSSIKYIFSPKGIVFKTDTGQFTDRKDNQEKENHHTPIMLAAKAGHLDVVKMLCENGASAKYISSTDSNDDTAKHHAARAGHKDIMDYLEEKGDKRQEKNKAGKTPNDLYQDFQAQEAARKKAEFNKNLAKVAICALAVVGVAFICYNRAAIANMLNFGKSGLSVS